MRRGTWLLVLLLAVPVAAGEGRVALGHLRLVPPAGMTAGFEWADRLTVPFRKTSEERRLLAFEARPEAPLADTKALEMRYSLRVEGAPPRLAILAFDGSGGVWFRTGSRELPAGDDLGARLALARVEEAAFSQGSGKSFDWQRVEKVWLGLLFDGPAEGTFVLTQASLTSEPYRATRPFPVPFAERKLWSLSHDPAATLTVARVDEGRPRSRIDFVLPGGRHMYAVPSVRLPELELSGFSGLRFTYRAMLPKGIDGLLVMLIERSGGTQYYADPAPKASSEWTTVTIPFERFQRGSWSKDDNDRLDLDAVLSVAIGVHGTTTEAQGKGAIWLSDIAFVP